MKLIKVVPVFVGMLLAYPQSYGDRSCVLGKPRAELTPQEKDEVLACLEENEKEQELIERVRYNKARCDEDSLDIHQGKQRALWAINKCAHRLPRGFAEMIASEIDSGRPLYPTFGELRDGEWKTPGGYKAPVDVTAECNIPKTYRVSSFCTSGCFGPEELIWFSDGVSRKLSTLDKNSHRWITSLSRHSTLGDFDYRSVEIAQIVASDRDAQQEMVEVKTSLGKRLFVTTNHPVLLADGKFIAAGELTAGMKLSVVDGSSEEVDLVVGQTFFGKVYQLDLESDEMMENIIVSDGGLMTGSLLIQNSDLDDINRRLFRANLQDEV